MTLASLASELDRTADIVRLAPQIVGRFYADGNRLGQRVKNSPRPPFYTPERWIGSSTMAANPPEIPAGGLSECAELRADGRPVTLKQLVADPDLGPRLLGDARFRGHGGEFRVLIKILDALHPIPFHVHADDAFVQGNPKVYPNERFGKDEAYHFLDAPKGECPFTHIGVRAGVTARDVIAAMRRGTDHVLELSPPAEQRFGEGYIVRGGTLHRPGTALTLEIQQPSDVYTMFQTDFGPPEREPIPQSVMHPGFATQEEAAEAVVNWGVNTQVNLVESSRLRPTPVGALQALGSSGGQADWIFPLEASRKFSGIRLTVQNVMTVKFEQPCVLWVWRGRGTLDGQPIDGGGGAPAPGRRDEFFLGQAAVKRGVELKNAGEQPLVAFAMFAAVVD
jgi:hypothetical protein